jgi:hypothetical protein
MEETLARRTPPFFARNRASGRVYGFTIGADRTMKDGSVVKTYRRWSVKARLSASDSQAEIGYPDKPDHWQTREAFKKWEYLDLPAARAAWAEDFATRPKEETHTVNLLTGVLLPIWDRLKDLPTVRVQRALTDDGEMVLGRLIPAAQVDTVLSRLTGSSRAAKLSPRQLFDAVLKDGATVILANNWRLVPRRVSGQMRIELTGPREQAEIRMIQSQGVMYERIGYEPRYFVPTDPEAGSAVLERVTANRPAVELVAGKGAAAEGADPGVRFHLAYHGSPHDFTRQRTPAGTGEVLSAAFMQARADATAKAWKGLAGIAVRAVQRERDLPAPALDELARVRASNPGAFPKAVWVPGAGPDGRGKIVLVADNLRDVRDGLTRLVHEAVGHVGVQAVFGPRLASFLDELIETRSADVALYARQYGLDMERLADRRVAAEELLAHMAEINAEADRPFLERVYQAIRAALRALGVRLRLSDGDLREILAAAGRYVREGDARGALAVRSRFAPKPGGARPGGGRFMVSGPNPSDPILIDSGVVWGEITPAIAREAKQQTRQSLVAAPIRLLGGVHLGKHRGYGLAHVEAEHGDEIRALGMSVEEFIAQAIAEASQIWADGRRLVLARTGRRKTASVIELMQGDGYYSVVTAFPVTKQFKTFGDLAWRGRKLAGITQNQAPGLDSQGSPLVDRQLTNPPEPLSGNDVLHPPLEALRGQPDDSRIDAGDGEDKPDGGPRFSLDSSRLDGGLPTGAQALDDAADSAWAKLKETIGNQAARLLPASLQSLTLRQLAEVGAKILPGIERYDALRRQMESARNGMMEEAGEFAQEVFGAWVYGGKDRPLMQYLRPKVSAEARALFDLIHQATLANVDPAEAHKPLSFTMALGPGWPDQRIEVSEASLEDLKERIERWKGSDENRNRAPYAIAALKQVERLMPAERKRRAARPALVQAWNALSQGRVHDADGAGWDSKDAAHKAKTEIDKTERRPTLVKRRTDGRWIVQAYGAQEIYREARDLYKDRDRQRFEALLARIKDDTALDPAAKEKEIARMRADFESSVTRNGKIKVEPYFPLYRTGQYYVAGRLYVDAAPAPAEFYKDDVAQTPYKTDEAAWSASRKRAELARYNLVPVKLDDDSGWILREVGEPFFGRYATPGEAKAAAAELANEGYAQIRQGMVKKSEREVEGVTEGFIADAVTKLTAAGDTEAADLLHQMYLAQLNELSQRTHFIHRKGIAGYEDSALAAFGHTMFHLSHQIAKLQYGPRLAEQVRVIEENKAERADAVRADAFLGELKERHGWVMNPDNAPWTNVTAALGFFWYLGVSPAAALVNLTQTPIIAYPILAARFNDWRGAGRAMRDAFADVRCGMGADQLKGYLQGKPHPALPANLSAQEKAAFEAWTLSGGRDVTQAHNLAGIGDSDRWNNSPAATRAMGILSSGFHLAEVVNRDVTLLAAYRLARAKGMRHKAAVELADKLTTDSHLDYGNANRARFMQSNTAKALLMFKSYSQGIVYLLGRSVWQATAGESAEVKREARQRLTGILGMTFLASGAAGLPLLGSGFAILNLVAAAFGDDDEPWDAETEFRSFLTRNLPGPFAAVIDRGAVNALTGLDISSRVGLSTLVFREPERDLDGAGTYQYMIEQILGPLGGIASSPFTAYDHLREGHVNRALEAMTPKFVRDALKAGRYATEGVRTRRGDPVLGEDGSVNPWETVWQALGFSPDRVSAAWDTTNMLKLYEGRIVDRRTALQTALALATIDGDAEAQAAVLPKIRAWNQHWAESPKLLITPRTVRASVRGRERYSERARSGVALNPGVEGLRERVGAP